MLTLSTIKTAAFAIAGFIVLGICSGLISANVRRLATEFGWDTFFLWAWNAAPAAIRKMLSGWKPLRQLWWLWLSLGVSGGLGVALWLLAPEQMSISTPAVDIAKATGPIRAELDNANQQIASLQSQLDAKTVELGAAQHKLQDVQNRPALVSVSPPIDLSSGKQKNLFFKLVEVFGEYRIQQSDLSAAANDLSKANGGPTILSYSVPPCRIMVSSTKDNEMFAKLIETIAQSQGCQAQDSPTLPPPPRPTDADEPTPKQLTIPDPLPYIVVRYPKPEDVQNLPETPMGPCRWHCPAPSQEINEKAAKFREQITDKLLAALQGCGLDARRSHKAEGSVGWPVDKWTIYIDLGNVQICR